MLLEIEVKSTQPSMRKAVVVSAELLLPLILGIRDLSRKGEEGDYHLDTEKGRKSECFFLASCYGKNNSNNSISYKVSKNASKSTLLFQQPRKGIPEKLSH